LFTSHSIRKPLKMKIILSKLPSGSQARKTFRRKLVSTNYCISLIDTMVSIWQ